MLGGFVKNDDERLNLEANLEVQIVDVDGTTISSKWHETTTLNDVFLILKGMHRSGVEISVLDIGDELIATISVNAKTVKHYYRVQMMMAKYISCPEDEATHVQILKDELEHYKLCNLEVGKIYEIFKDEDEGSEGEEMIRMEDGRFLCDFSLVVEVDWVKKLTKNMRGIDDVKSEPLPN